MATPSAAPVLHLWRPWMATPSAADGTTTSAAIDGPGAQSLHLWSPWREGRAGGPRGRPLRPPWRRPLAGGWREAALAGGP